MRRTAFAADVGTSFGGGGRIAIETFQFEEAGSVVSASGLETWDVVAGDVKFDVSIDAWQFCAPCVAADGAEVRPSIHSSNTW